MENTESKLAARVASVLDFFDRRPDASRLREWLRRVFSVLLILLLILMLISFYWSREPEVFWINKETPDGRTVTGYATTDTLMRVMETMLDKPGGYLYNDIMVPGVFLDNIPNFEKGVITQTKDLVRALRNDYSRSQSQSLEDPDLAQAEPAFNFTPGRWILPSTEKKFREGVQLLESYRHRITDQNSQDAQFFARADNLREWLIVVEKRLGGLSQSLTQSVGRRTLNTDLAGDPSATASTQTAENIVRKTPWYKIDDVFFEARGNAWALVHFLRAVEFDFAAVLEDKNATVSLRQIIRELESSLDPIRSPIILNGGGYGMTANHSLVMASYLSRANSAVINLRELLDQG
ncbi:MAG: DUF2333 family protein [Gammaproteobacteria bacterium]|nr:DUF2333 family protein [Gammaproteobacteria bacterium]